MQWVTKPKVPGLWAPRGPKVQSAQAMAAYPPPLTLLSLQLLSQETVVKFVRRHSLVLERSDRGAFRRSLHDPDGQESAYVSEAHEHDGHLYLGSFRAPFLCRLRLQDA